MWSVKNWEKAKGLFGWPESRRRETQGESLPGCGDVHLLRVSDLLMWEGTSGLPSSVLAVQSRLLGTVSVWVLSISKDGRLQNLSGQPVPVLDHSHSKKSHFICLSGISCYFSLRLLPVVFSLDSTGYILVLYVLLFHPIRYFWE